MVAMRAAFFAFLLVLVPQVSVAGSGSEGEEVIPDSYPRLVREDPPAVEVVDVAPQKGRTALHDAGAKLIRGFICKSKRCLKKHGDRLTRAAHTVVDVCLNEPDIPKWMCLGFVATISNEGGGLEHPTCGGINQDCIRKCDKIDATGARRSCAVQCALDQGRGKGTIRRVRKCNDRWSSRGPFQMKRARIRQCKKHVGPNFDPFSLEQAARCTMRIIKRSATAKHWPCGSGGNRWMVAMKRVSAGVLRKIAPAQPGRWVKDLHGGKTWIEPVKATYEKICEESRYGHRGLRHYRACGKPCQQVDKTSFATTTSGGSQVTVEGSRTPVRAVPRCPHGG